MQNESNDGLALIKPRIVPPLDAAFRPAVLTNHSFQKEALRSGATPVSIALTRADGGVSRFDTFIPSGASPGSFRYVERLTKFLLWSRGGYRVDFAGLPELGAKLQGYYRDTAAGQFDAEILGKRIYERPFELVLTPIDRMPQTRESSAPLGRRLEGCRIGFDLGASDRKVAAVQDGKVVFSNETPWDPRSHSDPQWHFDQIMSSLKQAAAHLPRVDAIGGSSAGVYVQNQVKVASLFRGVPEEQFQKRVKGLFLELKRAWNNIPFDVVNDGEVTALAGSMALNANAVLGISMGSSQAGGYVTAEGNIISWLNELAFVPIDYNPAAPRDEWSGDYGCGVQYFSQQAVGRLLAPAGIKVDPGMALPEKLVHVQELMSRGDERAAAIYRTIGVYLGYTIPHYANFYNIRHLLILGRVTTGKGGDILIAEGRRVLAEEFPDLAETISLHVPDEKEKRHGQAIAAASLPKLN